MYEINSSNDNYLKGQFLIATPMLVGSCFEKSVIYLCSHDSSGAMGILINRSIGRVKPSDVFKDVEVNSSIFNDVNMPVYYGGPVELSKGFVLHSGDYKNSNTVDLQDGVSLTSDVNVLKDITCGMGPSNSIVAFGYAGWGAGQLEDELMSNAWINTPATKDIIFKTLNEEKWQAAADIVGVDIAKYSNLAGHA